MDDNGIVINVGSDTNSYAAKNLNIKFDTKVANLQYEQATINAQNAANTAINSVMMYDCSAKGTITFATLDLAIAAVPLAYQNGGLHIKFVDTASNKYNTYFLTTPTWSTSTSDWQYSNENIKYAKNGTGSTVAKGKVVYINSSTGDNPIFQIATNTDYSIASRAWGITMDSINNNAVGRVIHFGIISGMNTSAYPVGTELWLGTNGDFTNVRPTSPAFQTSIGMVIRQHATVGSIFVNMRYVTIEGVRSQNPNSAPSSKLLDDELVQVQSDLNIESISNKVLLGKNVTTVSNTPLSTLHLTGTNGYQNSYDSSRYVKSGSILRLQASSISYAGRVTIATVLGKALEGETFYDGEIKVGQSIDVQILTMIDCYGYIIHEWNGGQTGDITLQLDRLDYSTTLAKQSDVSLLDKSLSSNINLTGLSSAVFSTTTKLLDFKFKKGDKYVITASNIIGSGKFGIYTSTDLSASTHILKGTGIELGFNKLLWTVPSDVDVLYGYSSGDISLDLSFTLYSIEQTDYQLRKSNYDLIGQDFPAINLVDIGQLVINPSNCCDLVLRAGKGTIINNPYTNVGKAIKCNGTGSSSSRTYDGLTIGNTYTIIAICSDTNNDYGSTTNYKLYTDDAELEMKKIPFLYEGKNLILAYNTFTAVATSKVALYTTYTNNNELYAELLINGSDISSVISNLDNIINNYNYYKKTWEVNLADLSKTVSILNYKPIYTNIATNKKIITGIGIDNLGFHYTNANSSIARIPVKSDTVYSIFNHFVETVYRRVTFLNSNLGQLGVGNAYIEGPHAADYTFATKATASNYYGERVYVKTPNSAAFIEIEIYDGMDVSKLGVYEGIFYKDPKNAQAKDFSNNKLNVLLLGDSYWEDTGGTYDGRVLSNNLRGLIGINYIMNLAQGGGRLIHSDTTTDITSDVAYPNGDVQNVYSNQFLKYKFRHEASPTDYPIPDAIFICGVTNNIGFYPAKFDNSEYDSVWANTFSGTLDELKFAGAFRGLIKRITDYLGYNIPIYFIGTVTHPSVNYSMRMINEQFKIASSSHGIPFIDPSACNCSYLNSSIWRDGTHPNNIGAPIMAKEIARILIEQYGWNDCR